MAFVLSRSKEQTTLPRGQFPTSFNTDQGSLRVEDDAKTRFYLNVLFPITQLLQHLNQGAIYCASPRGFKGRPDYVLCTDDNTVPKMPVEMKTRHNLNLDGFNFWNIYRHAQRVRIEESGLMEHSPDFRFRKKILSQAFGQLACNGLHYGILSNYSDTYFLNRKEEEPNNLYVSRVVEPDTLHPDPTLRECVYYISCLALNDNAGTKLTRVKLDNISSEDDNNDNDDEDDSGNSSDDDNNDFSTSDYPSTSSSSREKDDYPTSSSSRGITTIDEYIDGGSFGDVFSGKYRGQAVV